MEDKSLYERITCPENLFSAWEEFRKGKGKRVDVMAFEAKLEENIFALSRDLKSHVYRHGPYESFFVTDPKRRHVHKALIRDRILHHAVYRDLIRIFEPTFISHSFSCRIGKGNHKGVAALEKMLRKETKNYRFTAYVLKCDVKKFFDTINHRILVSILRKVISDEETMNLVEDIVESFESERSDLFTRRGVPIGNLTSQLFANIYMGRFDFFMKQTLRVKHHARYTDDFVIVSRDRAYLESLIPLIGRFLKDELDLELHPNKVTIRKNTQGIDFLGYVAFPHYRLMRKRTREGILRKLRAKAEDVRQGKISRENLNASLQSYLGALSHADQYEFGEQLKNDLYFF